MNYAWEAALSADQAGIAREELRYVPSRDGSPYAELVQEMMNNQEVEPGAVPVNPLYRFSKEFSGICDRNQEGYEQTREMFFDICMQYLVQQDLRQGLSRQEYVLRLLLQDLLGGVYGNRVSETVAGFESKKLRGLAGLVRRLYRCGSLSGLYQEAVRQIYPEALVYAINEDKRQMLVYVGQKETREERERLEFLEGMFLSVDYEVYLFWEYHFGILDVEETMVMGEMVLF